MPLKEQIDSFYKDAKWLLERYEKIANDEKERAEHGMRDSKTDAAMHQTLVDMSASIAVLARFQQVMVPLEDRLRGLEKKVREKVLPRYAGAAKTWDAQRAATEKVVKHVAKLGDVAKPLTTRAYRVPKTLPMTILASHHPRAAALADEAKRVVGLVENAVLKADLTIPINDLSFSVSHHLSLLTGER